MKRWNGWGDEKTTYPLPKSAILYLRSILGEGNRSPDASFSQVVAAVPPSRLWDNPWMTTNPETRLRHARGQSLPDWVALRTGSVDTFPDAVAFPTADQDLVDLLALASDADAKVIPYGGGTSVVGHINPLDSQQPVLTIDLRRMNKLRELDEVSRLATFEAGVRGPDLEAALNEHGFTLGHYPQSFQFSTLGGWIATRSSGQQSYHYGRIEDHFAGGHVETPAGSLELPPFPASAAGPDLRHLFLGSEGRFGVITRAIIRIRPLPEAEQFYGVLFSNWESGLAAVRQVAQADLPLSMLRLSDSQETEITFALAGKSLITTLADQSFKFIGYGPGRCLLIFGITGNSRTVASTRRRAKAIFRSHGSFLPLAAIGRMWRKSRFLSPYLRNTLWDLGYAVDTLETATPWSAVPKLGFEIKQALTTAIEETGEPLLTFAHLSHVYPDGASTYVTLIFRRGESPEETLERWQRLKAAASQAVINRGGTITHQHGVGMDHAHYLPNEKGPIGMALLKAVSKELDPHGILNPGKMFTLP